MQYKNKSFSELIDDQEPIYIAEFWPYLKDFLDNRECLDPKDKADIDAIIDLVVYEDPREL
jgi:hypothetical protein